MELHKFDNKLFQTLKGVGYQSIQLRSFDDDIIVTYNTPKQTIAKKIDEIKNRFVVLPPGVYKLYAMMRHGAKGKADVFLIEHGNIDANKYLNERPQPVQIKEEQPHVLSYEEALKRIEELAGLKAENQSLKIEIEILRAQNLELQQEIEELETETLQESKPGFNLQDFATSVLPVLDRYFDNEEKKMQLKEKQLQAPGRGGYYSQPRQAQPQRRTRESSQENNIFDRNNPQHIEKLVSHLDTLEDEQLNNELQAIQSQDAELYEYLISILFEEEEEEENEQ